MGGVGFLPILAYFWDTMAVKRREEEEQGVSETLSVQREEEEQGVSVTLAVKRREEEEQGVSETLSVKIREE